MFALLISLPTFDLFSIPPPGPSRSWPGQGLALIPSRNRHRQSDQIWGVVCGLHLKSINNNPKHWHVYDHVLGLTSSRLPFLKGWGEWHHTINHLNSSKKICAKMGQKRGWFDPIKANLVKCGGLAPANYFCHMFWRNLIRNLFVLSLQLFSACWQSPARTSGTTRRPSQMV